MTPGADVPRRLPGTDLVVHPFAIDGSVFGWASGVEETARILDVLVHFGGNLVSTADHYAGGRSEIMIGAWLKSQPHRERVLIATKVGRHPDSPGLSSRSIVRAAEASLARLETDYLDFLTLDGLDPATPIDETLEAVDMLRRAGKARWLAVSGYPAAMVGQINELAASAVYPPIRLVSTPYNLMQRSAFESDLAPLVKQLDIGVLARLPLASGYLLGDFHLREEVPSSPLFADALKHVGKRGNRVLQELEAVAGQHEKPVGRIALGWVLSKPGVVAAAIRIHTAEQLLALVSAGEVVLTRQQVSALDHASAGERRLI